MSFYAMENERIKENVRQAYERIAHLETLYRKRGIDRGEAAACQKAEGLKTALNILEQVEL